MDTVIRVQDTSPIPAPIAGVLVRAFSGSTLVTQAVTSAVGQAELALDPGTYVIRLSKYQTGFSNPYSIVVSATLANNFTISGDVLSAPISSDPNYCRCWGYFIDGAGQPFSGVAVWLRPLVVEICHTDQNALIYDDVHPGVPSVVGGRGIVASAPLQLVTDETGLGWLDLPRLGKFIAQLRGAHTVTPIQITVPDSPSVNILDLLLPYPSVLISDPVSPVTMHPGESVRVTPTIYLSDGQQLTSLSYFEATSSDESVATVTKASNTVSVAAVGPGDAQILFTPDDFRYPERRPRAELFFSVHVTEPLNP